MFSCKDTEAEKGRVTKLWWCGLGLFGTIPVEVEALSALTELALRNYNLSGLRTPSSAISRPLKS